MYIALVAIASVPDVSEVPFLMPVKSAENGSSQPRELNVHIGDGVQPRPRRRVEGHECACMELNAP